MQRERHAHLLWLCDAAANRCNALSLTPTMIINSIADECGYARPAGFDLVLAKPLSAAIRTRQMDSQTIARHKRKRRG
jgi:hypothetical protein